MTPSVHASVMVLAHQGGWDELFIVGAPVAVFGLLLVLARRRAEAVVAARERKDDFTEEA